MKQHKYTHLGQAPYRLVGAFYDPPVQDINGAWHGGMNTCDHCGRPISYVFMCKSSDGKQFNLGSVHVEDLGDSGLTQAVRTKAQEMKRAIAKEKREEEWRKWAEAHAQTQAKQRQEHEQKEIAEWGAVLTPGQKVEHEFNRLKDKLNATPHPNAYFARRGKSALDYINYFKDSGALWIHPAILRILREAGGRV